MLDNLQVLSFYLDKIDINWGPAFGTLIGIVRNDDFLPWKPVFDIYILKEDEERFKDVLWMLKEVNYKLVRHERRGLYILERNGEYTKVFVLHKISSDVRHTGGSDFIHEKYLQNTIKWDFKGIILNVPAEVDEYLAFQYGNDWTTPKQTVFYNQNILSRWCTGQRLLFKINFLTIFIIGGSYTIARRISVNSKIDVKGQVYLYQRMCSLQV